MNNANLSAEETRLVNNAKEMKAEATAYRDKNLKETWNRRNKFYMGDHWYNAELEDWQAPITINHCRKSHHWYLSLLTDAPAKLAVYGYSPDDYNPDESGLAPVERVTKLVTQKWDELQMENRHAIAMSYALIYSVGWLKPCISRTKTYRVQTPEGIKEIPDLDVPVIDPWHVLVDPTATWSSNPIEAIENAEYVIHSHIVSHRRLRRQYPHLAAEIDNLGGLTKEQMPPWAQRQVNPLDSKTQEAEWLPQANAAGTDTYQGGQWVKPGHPGYRSDQTYDKKRALVWECWKKDNDYPNGVVLTMVDDLLLQVRDNPYEHGHFPFIPIVVNPIPGRLYGFGILDLIIGWQMAYNKAWGTIFDHRNMFKGPPIAFQEGSIDDKKLVYAPGVKIPFRGDMPPTPLHPPQENPNTYRLIEQLETVGQELVGINESIMSGAVKAGTAGVAIEGAIEQAMQRIRMIDRWNQASRAELGYQMLSIMQQLYRHTGYELRVLGPQGRQDTIFLKPDDVMGKKDFKIITQTALSLKRAEQFKKLMDLSAAPPAEARGVAVPDDALIDAAGVPNPEKLKEEVAQGKSMQQMIQQLQMQVEELEAQLGQQPPAEPVGGM